MDGSQRIVVASASFAQLLGAVTAGLVLASLVIQTLAVFTGHDHIFGLVPLFQLDAENNVPTFYSSVLFLIAATLLAAIWSSRSRTGDRYARHWAGLSAVFVLLAVDEVGSIHDLMTIPVRSALSLDGAFFFAWVLPAIAMLGIFALVFWRFVFALPARTRNWMIASGVIFLAGALGLELVSAPFFQDGGFGNVRYMIVSFCEETLEMTGLVVFIYALLDYMSQHAPEIDFRVS